MILKPEYFSFEHKDNKGHIKCTLCPHNCSIAPEKHGVCGVRYNKNETMALPYAGAVSAIAMDPVEKKPLYHFYPGSMVFSIGLFGCSFTCPFCQNSSISQKYESNRIIPPAELINLALARDAKMIAYTYNEPTIHFEYIKACAELAHKHKLKNILVSNGHLNHDPAVELADLMDAANIDLKSFNPDFYKKELHGHLDGVLDTIRIFSKKTHLEVTTLVIPEKNDSIYEIKKLTEFLADLNPDIPYHLSAYYPNFKYDIAPTKMESILKLELEARKRMNYVYPGNITLNEVNTKCINCGKKLIKRHGYGTDITNINDQDCDTCGHKLPYII